MRAIQKNLWQVTTKCFEQKGRVERVVVKVIAPDFLQAVKVAERWIIEHRAWLGKPECNLQPISSKYLGTVWEGGAQ